MPVTSLIMVRFSIRKKFWKALDLLYQMAVETTGKRRKRREEMTETTRGKRRKQRTGLWLKIRLEMLSSVVSWFPPRGVVVSCLVLGSKLDWKCCLAWFMA